MLNDLLIAHLEKTLTAFQALEKQMLDVETIKQTKLFASLKQKRAYLAPICEAFLAYQNTLNKYQQAEKMYHTEPELAELAKQEMQELLIKLEALTKEIKLLLVVPDEDLANNAIVEIHGAVGGEEANLFASDLFNMYQKFADQKKWKIEVLYSSFSEKGGFSNITFNVIGKGAYGVLQFESGAHRVQRVPKTEAKGRVHTSVATVAVLPLIKTNTKIVINNNDLRIDTFSSSGAGGQSVNTTNSAVRILHLPTGTIVQCQDGRSQHANKEAAMNHLRAILYQKAKEEKAAKLRSQKASALGKGERSEKIRTYNYPQNRVTDHRINLTLSNLDRIMSGNLEFLLEKLAEDANAKAIENVVKDLSQN